MNLLDNQISCNKSSSSAYCNKTESEELINGDKTDRIRVLSENVNEQQNERSLSNKSKTILIKKKRNARNGKRKLEAQTYK